MSTFTRNVDDDSAEKQKDNKNRTVSRADSKRGKFNAVLASSE